MKHLRHIMLLFAVLLLGALWSGVRGAEPVESEIGEVAEEEKLDVVGIIFDHINDSYSWHIATINGHHVEIPLLCIVRSEEGKWYAFSSAKVAHNHTHEGFYIAPITLI